jgi:hypothetical protein
MRTCWHDWATDCTTTLGPQGSREDAPTAGAAKLGGLACCAVSPPATPTSKVMPLRRQSSLTSSPPMHPGLLPASAPLAGQAPLTTKTAGAIGDSLVFPSVPMSGAAPAALLAAQQPQRFGGHTSPAQATAVMWSTAAHAAAATPASQALSNAQPTRPAAYSIVAHAAAAAPAAAEAPAAVAAAYQAQLQQAVSAIATPVQPRGLAHPPLLPARHSVEDWPCSEPAALIRSAFSGPQPLLAALAEAQYGQVSRLVFLSSQHS